MTSRVLAHQVRHATNTLETLAIHQMPYICSHFMPACYLQQANKPSHDHLPLATPLAESTRTLGCYTFPQCNAEHQTRNAPKETKEDGIGMSGKIARVIELGISKYHLPNSAPGQHGEALLKHVQPMAQPKKQACEFP